MQKELRIVRKGSIADIRCGQITESGQHVKVYTVHPDVKHDYFALHDFLAVRDPVDEQKGSQLHKGQRVRLFRDPDLVSSLELTVSGVDHHTVPDAYTMKPIMPFWQKAAIGFAALALGGPTLYVALEKLLGSR